MKKTKMWIGNTYVFSKIKSNPYDSHNMEPPEHMDKEEKNICKVIEYKVQETEEFSKIASEYDLTFDELAYFNWKTTNKEKVLERIKMDIGEAEMINEGQDIKFYKPNQGTTLFIPQPWQEDGLTPGKTYAVYAKKVMHKSNILRIGVFFDGTNNSNEDKNKYSNVFRLRQLYYEIEYIQQRAYMVGVGVEENSTKSQIGGGLGGYADKRLEDMAYKIQKHFSDYMNEFKRSPKIIEFDIFGFSRGAALARHFVNLIHYNKIDFKNRTLNDINKKNRIKVNYLGIFDTVGSFAEPGDNDDYYEFHIDSEKAKYTYHLVSEDERRENFDLQSVIPGADTINTEYHEISEMKPFNRILYNTDSIKEEVWPGVHSDIGGGYNRIIFEHCCSNNFLSLAFLKKMHKTAIEHGVPFEKELKVGEEVNKIETKLELIDAYYELYPNLYQEHLKYNKIKDYRRYLVAKHEKEKSDSHGENKLVKLKKALEINLKPVDERLEIQKGRLIKVIPEAYLSGFLDDYSFIEKYKHTSHNPFTNVTYSGYYPDDSIGFNPNVNEQNTELYRDLFHNFMHMEISEIAKIEAKDHGLSI